VPLHDLAAPLKAPPLVNTHSMPRVPRSGKVQWPFFYPRRAVRASSCYYRGWWHLITYPKSSTRQCIFISPRTPVARPPHPTQNSNADSEGVELSLLGEAERRQAAAGLDEDEVDCNSKRSVSSKDKRAMIPLCVLCRRFLRIGFRMVRHFSS
jgi:hypothetical protein